MNSNTRQIILGLLACIICGLFSSCASPSDLGWAKPEIEYYHASSALNAEREATAWVRAAPGHVRSVMRQRSRSMWPLIVGGDILLSEKYTGQQLHRGLVISFARPAIGDFPAEPNVCHLIADVSADGRSVYMTGINNRASDGWYPTSAINYIVRRVVTQPRGVAGAFSPKSTMTTNNTSVVLSAAEIAALVGVEEYDLQHYHTPDFGVPGHWDMNKQSKVIYTELGIACLVDVIVSRGNEQGAAALYAKLITLRQAVATPSRTLIEPAAKNAEPYYRSHSTLA